MAENTTIGTAGQLVAYLKQQAVKHKTLYHYTNLAGALGILKSGYVHLTSIQSKNDKTEIFHGQESERENVFAFSFAHGTKENMSLWGLYSIPWTEGVRLDFKLTAAELLAASELYCLPDNSTGYKPISNSSAEVSLADVAYCAEDKNGVFSLRGIRDAAEHLDLTTDPKLIGYIKRDAWQYENETRIRVHMDNPGQLGLLALKLPDDAYAGIRITAAPWFKGNLEAALQQELGRGFEVYESAFANLVDYRDHCYYCAKKPFEREQSKLPITKHTISAL